MNFWKQKGKIEQTIFDQNQLFIKGRMKPLIHSYFTYMLNIPLVEKQSIEVEQKINEKSEKLSIFEKIEYRQIIKKNY